MGTVAERWKIEAVLTLVRRTSIEVFRVAGSNDPQSKTRVFMKSIGYRDVDVLESVQELEVADYSSGPLRDNKDRPRDLWVFGRYLEQYEVYIKLTAWLEGGAVRTMCVSFHEAEQPLNYPYKKAG